jgi:hypothetical protein
MSSFIFNSSAFRIEAKSRRGDASLRQMFPSQLMAGVSCHSFLRFSIRFLGSLVASYSIESTP